VQAFARTANMPGRRLTGALLNALLTTGALYPGMVWLAGLIVGPQTLREKIIISVSHFAIAHGRAGVLLVMLASIVLFTLWSLIPGARGHMLDRKVSPLLTDDALTVRDKLRVITGSWWALLLILLNVYWIAFAVFMAG